MSRPEPHALLRDEGRAAFVEPWEATALALATRLQEAGHFSAEEWAETLGAEIKAAQAKGDPDDGTTYYRHVLAALERLVTEKGIAAADALAARKAAWREAYETTPHGAAVTLDLGDRRAE